MAVFSGIIRSKELVMDTGLTVILPHDFPEDNWQDPCKVIYLMHGIKGCASSWTRMTSAERYAIDYGVAMIIPEVNRSFYIDMDSGARYFSYITKELPVLCAKMFNISAKREDTYVAGLSMGGYGAMKCLLTRPDLYCAGASFSGAVDLKAIIESDDTVIRRELPEREAIFGRQVNVKDEDDLFYLADKTAKLPEKDRPEIMMTCGTEDFLYHQNVKLRDYLKKLPYKFRYEEWPGDHFWGFWDKSLEMFCRHHFAANFRRYH